MTYYVRSKQTSPYFLRSKFWKCRIISYKKSTDGNLQDEKPQDYRRLMQSYDSATHGILWEGPIEYEALLSALAERGRRVSWNVQSHTCTEILISWKTLVQAWIREFNRYVGTTCSRKPHPARSSPRYTCMTARWPPHVATPSKVQPQHGSFFPPSIRMPFTGCCSRHPPHKKLQKPSISTTHHRERERRSFIK
jgi:hypothetical protein